MKRYLLTLLMGMMVLGLHAQNSKRVRELKNQKEQMQKKLRQSQNDLKKTRKEVEDGQELVKKLSAEIDTHQCHIDRATHELDSLNILTDSVKEELRLLDSALVVKKQRYKKSLRLAQAYRKVNNGLLFALAADDITQMYRRLRYTREYASYQRAQGLDLQRQQMKVNEYQSVLLSLKGQVNERMQILVEERAALAKKMSEEEQVVNELSKKEALLQKQVNNETKQVRDLQKRIDQEVAREIELARKRAEAEAKRKAENKPKPTKPSTSSGDPGSSGGPWMTAEDQKLNGGFVQNKGKLPVPITGKYQISSHFGSNMATQRGVVLTNKGVNLTGQKGAKARTVFDGEVSQVFNIKGTKVVLVRHGSYISVYCNLKSVSVRKGQKVKARDVLGAVTCNTDGKYELHFQLRRETTCLNPESWLGR